jgi:hypothetical protein
LDLRPHLLAALSASNRKGHPALLLDDELARAVRTEAKAAVGFWWGALTVLRGDGERL